MDPVFLLGEKDSSKHDKLANDEVGTMGCRQRGRRIKHMWCCGESKCWMLKADYQLAGLFGCTSMSK